MSLTATQRKIMDFLRDYVDAKGYPPSVREIGDALEMRSTSSVTYQLNRLHLKGYIRRDPNVRRGVVIRLDPR